MRPDEHKKKNSSRYKKKHGIANIGSVNSTTSNKVGLSSKDGILDTSRTTSDYPNDGLNKEFLNQEDSNTESVFGEKRFSKRSLSSNWEKYEEKEEIEEKIGADFKELVLSAGGASSQMILESEKNWSVDQELDDMLSIDFQKLADSLAKLPFCERMGWDESQFDPSLVKLVNEGQYNSDLKQEATPLSSFSFRDYNFDFLNPRTPKSSEKSVGGLTLTSEKDEPSAKTLEKDNVLTNCKEENTYNAFPKANLETETEKAICENDIITNKPTENSNTLKEVVSFNNSPDKSLAVLHNTTKLPSTISLPSLPKPSGTRANSSHTIDEKLEMDLDNLLLANSKNTISLASEAKTKPPSVRGSTDVSSSSKDWYKNSVYGKEHIDRRSRGAASKEQDDLEDWLDSII